MHRVCVVALDGVVPFDLATPCEVFGRAYTARGAPAYEVQVCGVKRDLDAGTFTLRAHRLLDALGRADTIILPGITNLDAPVPPKLLSAVRRHAARGARVASICTGAFLLAGTGLLDGRRATTHWRAAAELARRHPAIKVDADVLFVDEGDVLTSAGAAAGLDLCLHLVRRDHGAAVAAATARVSVMPLERAGGQAQFIVHEPPVLEGESLQKVLRWLEKNLRADLSLQEIARRAGMSTRTLSRRFREQTGSTPAQYVNERRVRRAQHLLETTSASVERLGEQVGFGSPVTFRERFREVVGTSPQSYRRAFGQSTVAPRGHG